MSVSSENLRHACASAAELSRHVWEALTPAQRSEMAWRYGHQVATRPFTSEIAQARVELQSVGLEEERTCMLADGFEPCGECEACLLRDAESEDGEG